VSEDGSQVPYGISLHNIGAVYVYGVSTRTNDGYVLLNRLEVGSTLSDAKTYDGEGERFGASVAVHGDTLVATVDNDHPVTGNASITGCVLGYVFVRAEPGVKTSRWEYKTFLGVAACASNLRHDKSVAIHGDVAVLGAPEHDHDEVDVNGTVRAHYRAGQAYVYTRDTAGDVHSSWSLSQTVHAESFAPFDHFGRAVGVARGGDAVVIGAPGKNGNESWTNVSNGGTASDGVDDLDRGAVYVFYRTWSRDGSTPTWTLAARFVSPPDSKREAFGSALATHGDGVVVGVDGLDAFPGASYYFALPQSTYDYDDDDDDGTVVVVAPAPEVPQKNDDPSLTDWRFVSSAVAIAIAATPLTFLVICIFLFKPWLRRKLLDRGWKRLADTIVPDWKYDVRLMHVEFSKLKEFIKEQSYPRLTNVRPILKADELKIADARDGGAHVKLGKPAMGAMTVGTLRGETVAVNSMFPGGAGPGGVPKKVAGSLAREVKNLATLNHPNLRLIKGCVPEKGVVVMEHCKGGSVREKMSLDEESGGMNKYETIAIALGAASGLAYLQRENVVHGDLTTDSMHLDEKGGAKLGDFGFSQTKKNIEKTTNARGWFGLGSPVQPTADSNPKDGNVRRNGNRPFVAVSGPVNESHEPADFFEDSAPARFWTGARSSRRAASRDDDERRNAPGPVCEKAEKNEEEEAEKAAWMAPELLKKGKKAKKTMESDVYALGMTLWHLYERRKPYGEASAYEIKVRVLNGERPVFKSTSVPVKIKGIVECCLKAKPKARPAATEISFMIQEAAKEMKKATKLVDKGIVKHEKRFET
jgi:serine/threonine protein kinase